METAVEDMAAPPSSGLNDKDLSPASVAKGKRTKRHRPLSPVPFTISPCPPTPGYYNHLFRCSPSEESTTTEDVDTARCLILLSQGFNLSARAVPLDFSNRIPPHPKSGGAGCVYTCKTCNRAFPSFQALGGHRASHKKPKNEKKSTAFSDDEDFPSPSMSFSKNRIISNSLSLQLSTFSAATQKSSPSPRMHECSHCGVEFTSGQALGGHMRKHRGGLIGRSSNVQPDASIEELELEESKRPRNGLSLDLNLPAPEDENQRFGLRPRQERDEAAAGLALSTTTRPPLIDCHY